MMPGSAAIQHVAGALKRLLTPFRIPAELNVALEELQRRADEVREERARLDQALVGAQASMIAGVLSHHQRLRGPRDV